MKPFGRRSFALPDPPSMRPAKNGTEPPALYPARGVTDRLCDRRAHDARIYSLTFDEARATHAIEFFPRFLRLADGPHAGDPFTLQPWQQFITGSLFGWVDGDGLRRFRTGYLEVAKRNGKTPLGAGLMLYLFVAADPAGRSRQIYSAAVTAEQAKIGFADAERMVEMSPQLRRRVAVSANNLAVLDTFSFFRAVSSEHRGLDGKRVHAALVDELHEHPTSLVADKMQAGTKGCLDALIVEVTNSEYDRASVCRHHHEYSRQVLERTVVNDTWFAFVCGLDDGDDPLVDEGCWLKANPNLGVSIPAKYLREQVQEAIGMPTKANIVLRLNFCVWTQADTRAIDMARWKACHEAEEHELAGAPCYAGLDLGQSDDFSALVLIWILDDGRVVVRPHFWLPEGALRRYPHRPYDAWRRLGAVEITPGEMTDYDVIERAVAEECRRWGARQCAYDRRFGHQLAQHLIGQGIDMIDTPQGFHLNEPLKRLLELVVDGELCHGDHPVLTWMASNLVVRHGTRGEIRIDKENAAEKVDGMAALVMALDRYVRRSSEERSIYESRGLEVLSP